MLEKELRYTFQDAFQLVDSLTVLNMINNMSTRFKVFEGFRIKEIQMATMKISHNGSGSVDNRTFLTG